MRKFRIGVSIVSVFVLASCTQSLPLTVGGNDTKQVTDSKKPFTYKIVPNRQVSAVQDDIMEYKWNKHSVKAYSNQIILQNASSSYLQVLLKKFGGRVLKQEAIPALPTQTGKIKDGTFRLESSDKPTLLPNYLLEMPTSNDISVDDLNTAGKEAGLTGDYEFSSEGDARQLLRHLLIEKESSSTGSHCFLNQIQETSTSTLEGQKVGTTLYELSPNQTDFWFTGPYWYGAYYGANICAPDASGGPNDAVWLHGSGTGIKVAVIDGGFQGPDETALPTTIVGTSGSYYSYNFENGSYNIKGATNEDASAAWHGRSVTSLIFAPHDDMAGTVGTAANATPILLHSKNNTWDHGSAIDTARAWGANVINMSYGGVKDLYDFEYNAIVNASNAGIILVAAAGNSGYNSNWAPAMYTQQGLCVSVGAHDRWGQRSVWGSGSSNYANVDIYAPGGSFGATNDIVPVAADPDFLGNPGYQNQFKANYGTSMAAPIVTGTVAVMKQLGYVNSNTTAKIRLVNRSYSYAAGQALNAVNAVSP